MASEVNIIINAKDQASGVIKGVTGALSGIAKVAGAVVVAGAAAFVALGKQALDATAEWERLEMTMQSLVARELRTADTTLSMADALSQATGRSEELLGWIQKLAIQSPFDVEGVATAFRTALAYGFTSDKAQQLTQNMIDFAAATGQPVSVMNQMALALGQIQAKGKLAGQEILQLVNAGVPVNDILKKMGFTLDDVSKGLVKSDEFLAAFSETMETDFAGAAARQTNTWAGLLNSFEDIKKIGLRELFAGIFDVLQPFASSFAEWLQGPGLEKLRSMGEAMGVFARNIVTGLQGLKNLSLGDVFENILPSGFIDMTAAFKKAIDAVDWGGISRSIAEKIDAVDWSAAGNSLTTGVGNILSGLATILTETDWGALLNSVTQSLAEFFAGMFGTTFEQVRAQADAFWFDFGMKVALGIQSTIMWFQNLLASIASIFASIRAAVSGAFTILVSMAVGTVNKIKNAFLGIASAIQAVIQKVVDLAAKFASLVIPDWLTPGSPTPFELGLLGINDAMKKLNVTTPTLGAFSMAGASSGLMSNPSLAAVPVTAGGGVVINLTYAPGISLASEAELEKHLLPLVAKGIRESRRSAS